MPGRNGINLALFYCRNISESSEGDRQSLEERFGKSLRLHIVPCSARVEPLDLLHALEEFADAVCLIACPEGICQNSEGERRARRRVQRAQWIIERIGLEKERILIMVRSKSDYGPLAQLAEEALDWTSKLGPSPVHKQAVLEESTGKMVWEGRATITAEQRPFDKTGDPPQPGGA